MTQVDSHVRWICSNPHCGWSYVGPEDEAHNAPRCLCGSVMEKVETVPVFTYLEFLRGVSSSDAD